jgi:hypothetical protein
MLLFIKIILDRLFYEAQNCLVVKQALWVFGIPHCNLTWNFYRLDTARDNNKCQLDPLLTQTRISVRWILLCR